MSKLYVVNNKRGLKSFFKGRGFYLVVMLCVAAVGALGYYTLMDAMKPDGSLIIGTESESGRTVSEKPQSPSAPQSAQIPSQSYTSSQTREESADVVHNPGDTKTVVYTAPLSGSVLKGFALDKLVKSVTMGDMRVHPAVDIAAPLGTPVCAAAAGIVEDVSEDNDNLLGMTIVIKHSDGRRTVYANLSKTVHVKAGDTVRKGEVIGSVGKTAQCEAKDPSHLHLEVIEKGGQVDPLSIIAIHEEE